MSDQPTGIVIPDYTTAREMFNAIVEAGHDFEYASPLAALIGRMETVHEWVPTFKPGDLRELAMYLLAYSASRNAEEADEKMDDDE